LVNALSTRRCSNPVCSAIEFELCSMRKQMKDLLPFVSCKHQWQIVGNKFRPVSCTTPLPTLHAV